MQFTVRHVPAGLSAVREEALEAASAAALTTHLRSAGSVVLEVRNTSSQGTVVPRSSFDVAWWCRELETLLRAGMTVVEAIETLAAGAHDAARDRVHTALLQSLREGAALSRAMRASGAFPEVLVAGVTASERTSTLAGALHDYLRYDELLQRLRRQAVSAALYPALVVSLGVLISLFLLLYVIPRFTRMYGELHGEVTISTQFVLWLSQVLGQQWPVLLMIMASGMAIALAAWRSGWATKGVAFVVDAIGPLRRQWDHFRLAKLYQSMALLFRGGYTIDEALHVCARLSLGVRMVRGIELARDQIARGKPTSTAMAAAELCDVTAQRLLSVGERTGAFDVVLQTIADRHAQSFSTFVERATRIVEPVLLLVVALVVGGLVVMMYMPIFDIAGGLGVSR